MRIASAEAAILTRLITPQEKLPQAAARAFLKFDFDDRRPATYHPVAYATRRAVFALGQLIC